MLVKADGNSSQSSPGQVSSQGTQPLANNDRDLWKLFHSKVDLSKNEHTSHDLLENMVSEFP